MPLLCSGCGFEVEGTHEIKGGLAQRHALDASPQVDDVAFLAAVAIEAVEDVLLQVDTEGTAAAVASVDGAGAAALRAAAA